MIAALLLALAQDDGLVVERSVRFFAVDTVGRLREIHRKERVKYRDGMLSIEDLTFGERLLIRTDKANVWVVDSFAGTMSELSFDQVKARQDEVLKEIAAARERVKGSADEEELKWLLFAYGVFAAEPAAEVRSTAKTETILGRGCAEKEVYLNGNVRRFSGFVDPSFASQAAGYFETLGRIGAYPPKLLEKFKELGGFPVRCIFRYTFFLDRVESHEEVTSAAVAKIAAADFDPPQGLTKVPLKGFEKPLARKIEKPKDFQRSFKEDDIDRENNPLRGGDKKEP